MLFGTDGIRGKYPKELTPGLIRQLGVAAGKQIDTQLILGYDSRLVGELAMADLYEGLRAAGKTDINYLGAATTPLIAYFSKVDFAWAIAVTASHNLHPYCGFKIFAPGALKLSDEKARELEAELAKSSHAPFKKAAPLKLASDTSRFPEYFSWLAQSLEGRDLANLKITVDAANGAASFLLPQALENLGAEVELISASPNGKNINLKCGSSYLQNIAGVLGENSKSGGTNTGMVFTGISFDGDADRMLACVKTSRGIKILDGDEILAILALDLKERGKLKNNSVVTTEVANLGFHRAMSDADIDVEVVPVGDINVSSAMAASGAVLGGEQSGHIVFGELANSGDGLLTAVQLLDVMKRKNTNLTELAEVSMKKVPQIQRNVKISRPAEEIMDEMTVFIQKAEQKLASGAKTAQTNLKTGVNPEKGRVLVRPSGTEPVLRIMVEGENAAAAETIADELAQKAEALNKT